MIANIYTKDWFNRLEKDYIYDESESMKGIVKLPNHKYSSFLYNEDRAERICSDKNMLKNELLGITNAVGLTGIAIILSEDVPTACTNGKRIKIGIGDSYSSISDCYEKLDRVIGMTLHESCHCLYTNFSYMRSETGKYPDIVHHIHNVIEDEIIEQKLIKIYPGYANFLNKLKYNIFTKAKDQVEEGERYNVDDILEILFYLIRYPKFISNIDEEILEKHENLFAEIKKIMKDCGCFNIEDDNCTYNSVEAAKKIYELLLNNDELNDIPNSGEGKGSTNPNISGEGEEGNDNSERKSVMIEILDEIFNIMSSESECTNPDKLYVYHSDIESKIDNDPNFKWDEINESKIANNPDVNIWKYEDKSKYLSYAKEITRFLPLAKKLIVKNKKRVEYINVKYNRNGALDTTRLANAMCNEQTVFVRKEQKIHDDDAEYALVIMLDESGSMCNHGISLLATKIAILLTEAVEYYPKVKLFIYGHGDCVYKYYDGKLLKNKYVLGNRRQQMSQDEIRSYDIIINDVKSQTKLPIVVFNITDSCYCTSEKKLAAYIEGLNKDTKQKTFVNLLALGHNNNVTNSVSNWNDIIYGKGNWLMYEAERLDTYFNTILTKMVKIIDKNVKL